VVFGTTRHLPALIRRAHSAYSVIEEFVEGFVEDFWWLNESTFLNLFMKVFGNGRTEKSVPLMDFPNCGANAVSGGLFDQIALCCLI
jgi:hypothetical protein